MVPRLMTGMEFIESPLLAKIEGLSHGFGLKYPGTREEARAAARSAFAERGEVFFLRQVHGCAVARPPWTEPPAADASATGATGSFLAIETADCVPVLVVDRAARRVAAAHAGWRGTVARVASRAVETLVEAGGRVSDLVAAIGPSIGPCCYEVGPDVEAAFGAEDARFFSPGPAGRQHLDVAAANLAQLRAKGLGPDQIDSLRLCTRCRPDLFFSYRRDGAHAGRMISVVGFSRAS